MTLGRDAIPFVVGGGVAGGVLKGPVGVAVGVAIGWALSRLFETDQVVSVEDQIRGLSWRPGTGSQALEQLTQPSGVSGPIATLSPFDRPATVFHA